MFAHNIINFINTVSCLELALWLLAEHINDKKLNLIIYLTENRLLSGVSGNAVSHNTQNNPPHNSYTADFMTRVRFSSVPEIFLFSNTSGLTRNHPLFCTICAGYYFQGAKVAGA